MQARSTTFRARPDALETGIAVVRDEVTPVLLELPGCVGLSLLADRQAGTCIITTAWESQAALRGSAGAVAPLRARVQEHFGVRPQVCAWEVGLLHRAHATRPGACARVTWLRLPRRHVDQQVQTFRSALLPRAERLPGFCSASMLVDRLTGRAALAVVYDTRDALAVSRPLAAELRADALRRTSSELLDVAELDVVVAHLRVPETV